MAKIILNPTNGAPIQDVQIAGKKYFVEKPFEVGTLIKIEDDTTADALLEIFEFLVYMTGEDAKSYQEEQAKKKFPCDKCSEVLMSEQGLKGHREIHLKDEKLANELGIETIESAPVEAKEKEEPIDAITSQARADGLDYGEGMVNL